MTLFIATAALGLAVFLIGEIATAPQRSRKVALKRAAGYGRSRREGTQVERLRFRERVLAPSVERLASIALRLNPKATADAIGTRLLAAGLSQRFSATQFLALKAGLALAGVVLGVALGAAAAPTLGILCIPLLGVLGFRGPDFVLSMTIRSRQDRVRSELPDALDLLAVSVEAGLGLDGAITKLTEHMQGALVDEFALTLGEIRVGENRSDALKKMAQRVDAPELSAFVRSIVQADQLGISLGRILRVQAGDMRYRRQMAAEEKAMKAPVKMLFPTVMFIFPAMFVVILGPAVITLLHTLK
jgi:tight adherence protein C